MYSIFANDMCLYTGSDVSITQYADDTQVLVTGRKADLPELISRMENALGVLFNWFCQNLMKVNADKTKLIVMGTPKMLRNLPRVTLDVDGAQIIETDTAKNLGILFDRHLSFDPHIDDIVARCNGLLIALNHAKHGLPREVIPTVVNGLVMSILRYCMSVYGSASKGSMHRVQKVINFCARVISGRRKHEHISDVLSELGWLSAHDMCTYRCICLLQQCLSTGEPATIAQSVTRVEHVHDRNTRAREQRLLRPPAVRSESGKRTFMYRAVSAFNSLPSDVRVGCRRVVKDFLLDP